MFEDIDEVSDTYPVDYEKGIYCDTIKQIVKLINIIKIEVELPSLYREE